MLGKHCDRVQRQVDFSGRTGVGSRPHLASVLQESRKSANIHAVLEFNWRIPVEGLIETAEEQRSSGEPRRKGLRYDGWRQARHRMSDVHDSQSSACRAAGGRRTTQNWSKRWPSALVFRAYPASSLSRRANKLPEPRARCLKPRCSNGLRARWRRAAGIILLTLLAATHEPFTNAA